MVSDTVVADGLIRKSNADPGREEAFLPTHVPQSHASFLLACTSGDLLCTWFAGEGEGKPDGSIYLSRLPKASNQWRPEVKVSDDPGRSEQNPLLFEAPSGDIWLLYTAQTLGNQGTAFVRRRISQDGGETWGPIEDLFTEPGTFIRQPIVVLSNGDWLLPIFQCAPPADETWSGQRDRSFVMVSTDAGVTWTKFPVPDSLGAVHMNIVERADGTLLGLFRSRSADNILKSISTDHGRTWTAPEATDLPNNNSSIQCRRVNGRRLALVFNNTQASKAAREHAQGAPVWGSPRSPLTIALSADEGETWGPMRDIEVADVPLPEINSDKADRRTRELSYPTVTETEDGMINVAFTYYRQAIKFVRFPPTWIEGK